MTTIPRPKRIWRPWYEFSERPICFYCKIPCIVKHTETAEDGKKIQHRYCPKCGTPFKTTYTPESESKGA